MPSSEPIVTLLHQAISLHQQGRFEEALDKYRQTLAIDPSNYDALYGMGMLHGQTGRFEDALNAFTAACGARPDDFVAHYNRAMALQQLQRLEEAASGYRESLSLKPDFAEAYLSLGNVLKTLRRYDEALAAYDQALALESGVHAYNNRGAVLELLQRYDEALVSYERAITLNPAFAKAHNNRGALLERLGRYPEALASYDRAVVAKGDYAEAYFNRGNVNKALGRRNEAMTDYDKAIALDSAFAAAHNNRGVLLEENQCYQEALASYERAIALKRDYSEAHYNRGNALKELRRYDEALASYDKTIALNPEFAKAYGIRGVLLKKRGRYQEALADYERAIAIDGDYAEALHNKGMLKLLLGDYSQGWPLYEWRWKTELKEMVRRFERPLWLGDSPIAGKTLLLYTEQGRGDAIQMVRYVAMAEAQGAKVILEVPAALLSLFGTMRAAFSLVSAGDPLPAFDVQCPLMSLPLAFKTMVDTIPAEIPYLFADPQKREEWRQRLGVKSKPRIGLAWSGNAAHSNDRNRSMALNALVPFLRDHYEFHSLQKELREEDRGALSELTKIRRHEDLLNEFADTAALIAELDLVITVDTAVAHLAGAMGKPVWILLPFDPDFRWLLARSDSPWYPTARLFRQRSEGDWQGVTAAVDAELPVHFRS